MEHSVIKYTSPEEIDDAIALWNEPGLTFECLKQQQIQRFNQYCDKNCLDHTTIPQEFKNLRGWKIKNVSNIVSLGSCGTLKALVKPKIATLLTLSCYIHCQQEGYVYVPLYFSLEKYALRLHWITYECMELSDIDSTTNVIKQSCVLPHTWFTTIHIVHNAQNLPLPALYKEILPLKYFYALYTGLQQLVEAHQQRQ